MAGRSIKIEFLGSDKSASSTATSVEKKFGKLGGTFDKVGQKAGKILAVGVLAGGAALYKMTQSAAEDEAAQVKLATALKNNAGATDDQIASTEDWITAQGKQLGVSDDELRPALARLVTATKDVGEAQDLASLAMDVSAGTGKSLTSVTEALMKAQNGSVGGLGRLGVATKNAAGDTLSLDKITKNMAETYKGQAAKAAETAAGKQKILSVQMAELGEKIGTAVLPVMNKLVDVGMKVVDWIDNNTKLAGIFIGVIGGGLAVLYLISAAMRAWLLITKAWSAVTKIAAAVQWLFNAAMSANPIGLVIIAIAALVAGLIIAYKKSETFRKIVDAAFKAVKKVAEFAFNWVKDHWKLLLAILTGPIGLAVLVITKNWDKITAVFKATIGVIKTVAGGIKDAISGAFDWVMEKIRSIPDRIKGLVTIFSNAGKALISAFVDGMKGAAGLVSDIAGNIWDAVKGLLNDAIGKINSALEFKISLPGPDISINPPNIPYLAGGTRNFAGGLAVVGERGPELVALPRGSNVYSNAQSRRMSSGSDTRPIVVQLMLDGKMIQQSLLRQKRINGNVELGIA